MPMSIDTQKKTAPGTARAERHDGRTPGSSRRAPSRARRCAEPMSEPAIDPVAPKRRIAALEERLRRREAAHERDHGDAADHDEREARIPRAAGDVEEAEHLRRLRHARDARARRRTRGRRRSRRRLDFIAAPPTWRTTNTVAMPTAMKTSVATIERGDRRLMPHRPWPLVQPLPRRVPKPTSRPADEQQCRVPPRGRPNDAGCSAAHERAATDEPDDERQRASALSPGAARKSSPTMPVMPATRPFKIHKSAAASPMSAPPTSALIGVKCATSIGRS